MSVSDPCRHCLRRTVCPSTKSKYSRTSMARTSLGQWKIVRNMGSSSHWLIMVPGQEANDDNLGKPFQSSIQQWCVVSTH